MGSSSFGEQVAHSVARLREHQERINEVKRSLAEATESATSRDRSVTATVGGGGELLEFQFHSEEFRAMPAAELSAMLVELANEAREKMTRRVAEAFEPLTRFGAQLRESMTAGGVLADLLAPLHEARRRHVAAEEEED
jgi:DNA-binding protein YbaB